MNPITFPVLHFGTCFPILRKGRLSHRPVRSKRLIQSPDKSSASRTRADLSSLRPALCRAPAPHSGYPQDGRWPRCGRRSRSPIRLGSRVRHAGVADQAGISSVARSRILRLAARIASFLRSVIENAGSLHPVNGAALPEAIGRVAVRRAGQDVADARLIGRRYRLGNCECGMPRVNAKNNKAVARSLSIVILPNGRAPLPAAVFLFWDNFVAR
jgi:hypothetical protein